MSKKSIKDIKEIIIFENPDKAGWTEKFDPSDLGRLCHPFRGILAACVSAGKSVTIKNIVLHADPPFDRIVLYHISKDTKEYDDMNVEVIDKTPSIDDFSNKKKNLLIIEDICVKDLNKSDKNKLDRMFGYASSHNSVSILLTAQDPFQVPVNLRRCSSHLFIWKSTDKTSLRILGDRYNMLAGELQTLLKQCCETYHDFLILDLTVGAPFIRKNFFHVIKEKQWN